VAHVRDVMHRRDHFTQRDTRFPAAAELIDGISVAPVSGEKKSSWFRGLPISTCDLRFSAGNGRWRLHCAALSYNGASNSAALMTGETVALGFIWYVVFLLSTTCHEAAHALAATLGGDLTAFHGGQVSLDPIPHIR